MAFPLNFTLNNEQAIKPVRLHENSVAFSLFNPQDVIVEPFEVVKINTGISFEMSGAYYGQIENAAEKSNFLVLGGVVDPGFRGNIIIALINLTDTKQHIVREEKVAQLIFIPVLVPELINQEKELDILNCNDLQMHVFYTKTAPCAFVPKRFGEDSVGFDLKAINDTCVPAHGTVKIDIGIYLEMKGGPFYGQIRDKSGFSTKRKLHVVGGVLDASHKNSIIVHLTNLSSEAQNIYAGEEIAQLIFIPVILPKLVLKHDIDLNTFRGTRGFQSGETKSICDHIYS